MQTLIQVIDDDDAVRESLEALLEALGFAVMSHCSAEDYLEQDRRGDCVLLDINMPGMSGFDLLRLLAGFIPPVPVLVLTACRQPEVEQRAQVLGASEILFKPVPLDVLTAALRRVLGDEKCPAP